MVPTFEERGRAYLVDVRAVFPRTTCETYTYNLRSIGRLAGGMGDPVEWGEMEVLKMRDLIIARYASNTANSLMAVLGSMLAFHGSVVMVQMRQRRRLRMPEPERGVLRWHSVETVDLLLTTAEGTLRIVLVLGFYLGLRSKEMVDLNRSDVMENAVRIMGKGQKSRTLPLEGATQRELQYYMAHPHATERLLAHDGMPYTTRGIRSMLERHGKRMGTHLSPHDMRRTFGRQLWKRGVRIETISKLMGHKHIATTIRYLGIDQDDLRDALRTLAH